MIRIPILEYTYIIKSNEKAAIIFGESTIKNTLLFIFIFTQIFTFSLIGEEGKVQQHYEKGLKHFELNEIEMANEEFSRAISLDSDFVEARVARMNLEDCHYLVEKNYNSPKPYFKLGHYLMLQKQVLKGLDLLKKGSLINKSPLIVFTYKSEDKTLRFYRASISYYPTTKLSGYVRVDNKHYLYGCYGVKDLKKYKKRYADNEFSKGLIATSTYDSLGYTASPVKVYQKDVVAGEIYKAPIMDIKKVELKASDEKTFKLFLENNSDLSGVDVSIFSYRGATRGFSYAKYCQDLT